MCLDARHCPRRRFIAEQLQVGCFFHVMDQRLTSAGGLLNEAALRELWRREGRQLTELDDLLDGGGLLSILCASQRWLPAFQFEPDGTPRMDVAAIAHELEGAMDTAEILAWFACGNASLDGMTPIACLRPRPNAVLEVARLDRFISSA
jgi:hypothetical protein